MQVNFAHNYSKTFFKGGSISFKAKTESDKPLTAEEVREIIHKQEEFSQATAEALKVILRLLQKSDTPSIDIKDLKFKKKVAYTLDDKKFSGVATRTLKNGDTIEHTYASGRLKHVSRKGEKAFEKEYVYDERGLKEVIAETKYGTNITKPARDGVLGSRVITTESGIYKGTYSSDLDYNPIQKLTLNGKDIVETSADGFITTYTRRDGSVVVVDNNKTTTTIDYSNCSNRDKDKPIKEIYKGRSDKILIERHWENGDYELFNEHGELTETKRMKSDDSYIRFSRDIYGRLLVDTETFPPKPEGENTQYPEQFKIHPRCVKYDKNGNLSYILTDYRYRHERIRYGGWDEAANKIQSYSCPLSEIYFYPSGKIKTEHYGFNLNYDNYDFKIEFNENGQVDNITITNKYNKVVAKESSSRIKEKLNKAGYKGYAEYASDLQERARIAHSVQKRLEEVTAETKQNPVPSPKVKTAGLGVYNGSGTDKISHKDTNKSATLNQGNIVKTSADGYTKTYTRANGSIVVVENSRTETTITDYSNYPDRGENDPIKEIIRRPRSYKKRHEKYWKDGTYKCFDANGTLIETEIVKSNGCTIAFERDVYGHYNVVGETFPKITEGNPPERFVIHPYNVKYDENGNLKRILHPDYQKGSNYRFIEIDSWDGVANKIQSYMYPLNAIDFYPTGKIKSEHYIFELKGSTRFLEIKYKYGQVDKVIITNAFEDVIAEETSSQIKEELIKAGYKGYTEYAKDLKERAGIAYLIRECYYN